MIQAAEVLIAGTLLMLAVLAVRKPVARLFGAQWAYALWLAPLAQLLAAPFSSLPAAAGVKLVPGLPALAIPASSVSDPAPLWTLLTALWLTGAAGFALWQLLSYRRLLRDIAIQSSTAEPAVFGGIDVIASGAVEGPLAVGIVRRRIVVPADFTIRYGDAERGLVLEHELVHHRRGDIWWNIVALLLLALHWFNPLAHHAFRAFRSDQELSCDAAVTRRLSKQGRYDYAQALVKSASNARLAAACPLNQAAQLTQRLKMLSKHRPSLPRTMLGGAAVAIMLTGGVAFASSISIAARGPDVARLLESGGKPFAFRGSVGALSLEEHCPGGRRAESRPVELGGGRPVRAFACVSGRNADKTNLDAVLVASLERVKDRVDHRKLNQEQRARIRADYDAEIARIRSR